MRRLRVVVSLITADNDFQQEQAAVAEATARTLNVDAKIIYAGNNSVQQAIQLIRLTQSSAEVAPDAIMVEPVGTSMLQVARAAAEARIGWVVLNRDVDYLAQLRATCSAPMFSVSADNQAIGRIQGEQLNALMPEGGNLLYLEGPSTSDTARRRTFGMIAAKRADIHPKVLRGDWTEASGYRAMKTWLSSSISGASNIRAIGSQNDAMALGARRALQESTYSERDNLLRLPFTGCDGLPGKGQARVRQGALAATIITPPLTGLALEMLVSAIASKIQPPEQTLTVPKSYPPVHELRRFWIERRDFSNGTTHAAIQTTLPQRHG